MNTYNVGNQIEVPEKVPASKVENCGHSDETEVGHDDRESLLLLEQRRAGVEVVGASGVHRIAHSVAAG